MTDLPEGAFAGSAGPKRASRLKLD